MGGHGPRRRGREARRGQGASVHPRRAVREGQPLPRAHLQPRSAAPAADAHGPKGEGAFEPRLVGRGARAHRRAAAARSSPSTAARRCCPTASPAPRGSCRAPRWTGASSRAWAPAGWSARSAGRRRPPGSSRPPARSSALRPDDLLHSRFIVLWGTNTIVTNLHQWPIVQRGAQGGGAGGRHRSAAHAHGRRGRLARAPAAGHRRRAGARAHARDRGRGRCTTPSTSRAHRGLRAAGDRARAVAARAHRRRSPAWRPRRWCALARAYATTRPAAIRRLIGIEHHREGARMVRTIACLPALVGAWRDRGGGILGPTAWAAYSPLDQDALRRPAAGHARRQHGPPRARADRARPARPRARGLQLQPGHDGARQHARHAGAGARRPLHRRPRALPDRHRPLRRRRAAGHDPGRARRPRAVVGPHVRHLQRAGHRAASARRCPTPRSSAAWRARWASTARRSTPPTRSSRGPRSRAPGRRWTPSTSSACARWGGPRPTCPRTSGRSRRAASGRRPGAFACGPTACRPATTRRRATTEPLALMTVKSAHHFLNSTYANLPRHLAGEGEPMLEMHPDDAAARGIADGDVVRVSNARGEVVARARLGDVVRPRRGRAALGLVGLAQPRRHHGQRADDATSSPIAAAAAPSIPPASRSSRCAHRSPRAPTRQVIQRRSHDQEPTLQARAAGGRRARRGHGGGDRGHPVASDGVIHGCYVDQHRRRPDPRAAARRSTGTRLRRRTAQPTRRRSRGTSRARPGPQGDPGPARRHRGVSGTDTSGGGRLGSGAAPVRHEPDRRPVGRHLPRARRHPGRQHRRPAQEPDLDRVLRLPGQAADHAHAPAP